MADSSASLSPEKRLLQLIEASSKGSSAAAPAAAAVSPAPGRPAPAASAKRPAFNPSQAFGNLKALTGSFAGKIDFLKQFFADFRARFGIHMANKMAKVFLVVLIFFTLVNAGFEIRMAGRDPLSGLDIPERSVTAIDLDQPVFDDAALKNSELRNVFLPFAKREEVQAGKAAVSPSGRLAELTKTLKLTGISYNPDHKKEAYCMIEDLQKNITSFLREGDSIAGLRISKINLESVELEYQGEKIEIH